ACELRQLPGRCDGGQQHQRDQHAGRETDLGVAHPAPHARLRTRAITPSGNMRISRMASVNTTPCAHTGEWKVDTRLSVAPTAVAPASGAATLPRPPTRMDRKAGTRKPVPICGSSETIGVIAAPARPASAAPHANVSRSRRRVSMPRHADIERFAITLRAVSPHSVRKNSQKVAPRAASATPMMNSRYAGYGTPSTATDIGSGLGTE